ncbi:MAG: hypothetical protein JW880_08550, partial [Candidatus Thermoplasmatota archaeon]|nr:hypothetical protein [Candidatus Thermoplasmatota archaeon]
PDRDDVIGYRGFSTPLGTISKLKTTGNDSAYRSIQVNGPMWLGYHVYPDVVGAPNLTAMYDNDTKVLFMQGPLNFANYLQPNDTGVMLLYHSAPWIEFNVANYTWPGATALSLPGMDTAMEGSSISSMSFAMVALALALILSIVATVLVVAEVRRRD